MQYFIYPYLMASKSAKALRDALEGKLVLRQGSSYKYQKDHLLINWGCGECPHPQALNYQIMDLINKSRFFKRLEGTGTTPPFATSKEGAKELGYPVFARTTTEGHDGKGIVIADCVGQLVSAPLYVKGVAKTAEYRVHVGRFASGAFHFIGASKKLKKPVSAEMTNVPADERIWCGDTTVFGDFMTEQGSIPFAVYEVVKKAFTQFPELTFAAFDVVFNQVSPTASEAFVLEGNSAPMATPQTTKAYAEFFRKYAELANLPNEQVLVLSEPVAPPVATAAPQMSAQEVLNKLYNGQLSMQTIVEGYIQHVQK